MPITPSMKEVPPVKKALWIQAKTFVYRFLDLLTSESAAVGKGLFL